ncbi:DUF3179 domain-containing (seleno)protein [Tropicimonas sp. TH_r6]|uniref:DUF3179 domain-containing (seleno)protein n=1 Tax=Tropicimonas sp. TH_r6 TaxID=3082085 RepID=UPI002952D5B5|nr:DUF3179 domain-containing (seleno)protein [Tropicimonas sp. TH_r6]MDV7145665.1 DUF3179 domain-containing (seleno)protein [Tropicimonas sp. TH_r6]
MLANLLFYAGLAVSLTIGFMYFRDLGDVVQMILKVKRENMARFIRYEKQFVMGGLAAAAVMVVGYLLGGGTAWLFWVSLAVITVLYAFPYVWVHLGLRNQKDSAQYYSIEEAREWVGPTAPVIVIENNGHARAHPDAQILRPHLAGNDEGLGGEDVIMTYCAMANLGIGYSPSVEGEKLELQVLAQHGNNLILRDNKTGEPIQHIYGFKDADKDPNAEGAVCAMRPSQSMKPWPTFRMTFRAFQKAYPEGEVFLNKPSSNPLLRLLDMATEMAFSTGISRQHQEAAPVMDNMTHFDDRLPNKTYVWGVTVGRDVVCWTDDFVVENGNVVNATVGGRALVVAWDPKFESLGVWYNDSGVPVTRCDFWGNTDQGQLERVETLRAGLFWHVWVEFFPNTDINRVGNPVSDEAVA